MEYTNQITQKKYPSLRGLLNSIRPLNMTAEDYYIKFHKTPEEGVCGTCGNPTRYHGFGYLPYCSGACGCKSDKHRKAVSDRFSGMGGIEKRANAIAKLKASWKKVDLSVVRTNREETLKLKCEKLGISLHEYYSRQSKAAALNTTDEERSAQTLKRMNTMTERYGSAKTHFHGYKSYDLRGKNVVVQGYENVVLDYLQNDERVKTIVAGGKPMFVEYNCSTKNKVRRYFPDIFLPELNLLIEVKSTYTYAMNIQNTEDKMNGCATRGYSICLLIVDGNRARNGELDGSKNLLDLAISSQAAAPAGGYIYRLDAEGSTTILHGVGSSDPKCPSSIV